MKKAFWKADWFLGLVIALGLFGYARVSGIVPGLERWAYDLGVKMTSKTPSDKVAVIAIDEQSIANIGRWPWPREVQAKLIDQLAAAKAKVIGSTIILSEPQRDPGLAYVEKMLDVYSKAYPGAIAQEVPGVAPIGGATPAAQGAQPPAEVAEIGRILGEASVALNSDVRLAASVKKAGNVLLPLTFAEVPIDSFYDVYSGKIPASKYADKIVLIGATATGVGASQVTPISPAMAPVQTLAHSVSSILQEHFFVAPTWGPWASLAAYLLVAAYLTVLLPRLGAGTGAMFSAGLLVALFAAHLGAMVGGGLWLQLMTPAALLVVGHAALTTKRYLVTERGKEAADVASAE